MEPALEMAHSIYKLSCLARASSDKLSARRLTRWRQLLSVPPTPLRPHWTLKCSPSLRPQIITSIIILSKHNLWLNNLYAQPVALAIGHFTVVCLVTWPLSGSEAAGDLVLIQTLLFFICKCRLVNMRTT